MPGTNFSIDASRNISLNDFRTSVESKHENPKGFIRLSRRENVNHVLTRFGEQTFETQKNHASPEENKAVREVFYNALVNAGVKGETLAKIREDLGITIRERETIVTKNDDLRRSDIKHIIKTADDYLARKNYIEDITKELGLDDEAANSIKIQLGVFEKTPDEMSVFERMDYISRPRKKEYMTFKLLMVRAKELAIRELAKRAGVTENDFSASLFENENDLYGLEEDFKNNVKKSPEKIKTWLKKCVTDCNEKLCEKYWSGLEEIVDATLKSLEMPEADCAIVKDFLLSSAKEEILKNDKVYSSKQELLESSLSTLIAINNFQPPFSDVQKKTMLEQFVQNPSAMKPQNVTFYSEFKDAYIPLLQVSQKQSPSVEEVAKAFGEVRSKINELSDKLLAANGYKSDPDRDYSVKAIVYRLSESTMLNSFGQELKGTKGFKDALENFRDNLIAIGDKTPTDLRWDVDDTYVESAFAAVDYEIKEIALNLHLGDLPKLKPIDVPDKAVKEFCDKYILERPYVIHCDDDFKQDVVDFYLNLGPIKGYFETTKQGVEQKPVKLLEQELEQYKTDENFSRLLGLLLADIPRSTTLELGEDNINSINTKASEIPRRVLNNSALEEKHGLKAVYFMGQILGQTLPGALMNASIKNNLAMYHPQNIGKPKQLCKYTVRPQGNGQYDIHVEMPASINYFMKQHNVGSNPQLPQTIYPDRARNRLHWSLDMSMSLADDGKLTLRFPGSMTIKSTVLKSPIELSEQKIALLEQLKDPNGNGNLAPYALYDTTIVDNPVFQNLWKNFTETKQSDMIDFLKENAITNQEIDRLKGLGIPDKCLEDLLSRNIPTEKYPTKALVNNIFSEDAGTRSHAIAEFKEMLTPILQWYGIKDIVF